MLEPKPEGSRARFTGELGSAGSTLRKLTPLVERRRSGRRKERRLCVHSRVRRRPELSILCLRQFIGSRSPRWSTLHHLPLAPAPAWSATSGGSVRLQTHPAQVYLLRPSLSLGLGVDLPEGTAFFTQPGADPRGRRSHGGFSRSWERCHSSGQSSRLQHFFSTSTPTPGEGLRAAGFDGGGVQVAPPATYLPAFPATDHAAWHMQSGAPAMQSS